MIAVTGTTPVVDIDPGRSCSVYRDAGQARYLGDQIPGAKLVELSRVDHMPHPGDSAAVLDEVQEFLTGVRPPPDHDRVLATVLFTDIVQSTERAGALRDRIGLRVPEARDTQCRPGDIKAVWWRRAPLGRCTDWHRQCLSVQCSTYVHQERRTPCTSVAESSG